MASPSEVFGWQVRYLDIYIFYVYGTSDAFPARSEILELPLALSTERRPGLPPTNCWRHGRIGSLLAVLAVDCGRVALLSRAVGRPAACSLSPVFPGVLQHAIVFS